MIGGPTGDGISEAKKEPLMKRRYAILKEVKDHIDANFNLSTKIFIDLDKDGSKTIDQLLDDLSIDKGDYDKVLSISNNNDFQIKIRRLTNSCLTNIYFADALLALYKK